MTGVARHIGIGLLACALSGGQWLHKAGSTLVKSSASKTESGVS